MQHQLLTITPVAQEYLAKLKCKSEFKNKELWLEALSPDSPYAEASLSFVQIGPQHADAMVLGFIGFQLFVDKPSLPYLEQATIDINVQDLKTELTIDTPLLQPIDPLGESASLADQVQFLLETDINPSLASHGGLVRLVDITEAGVVKLQFGGGCQGCSMIDITLKQGVKAALLEKIPGITDVEDVTDHQQGSSPYC